MTTFHTIDGQDLEPWLLERKLMLGEFLEAAVNALAQVGQRKIGAIENDEGLQIPSVGLGNRTITFWPGDVIVHGVFSSDGDPRSKVDAYDSMGLDRVVREVINCKIVVKSCILALEATTVPVEKWLVK